MSNFADALETEIRLSGTPKRAIAEAAGISASYLSHLLSKFRDVTPQVLAQLLQAFDSEEARKRLVQAFVRDALESVRQSARSNMSSLNIVGELDRLLQPDLGELIAADEKLGNLPPQQALILGRVISRMESDAVFNSVLLEILTSLLKLPSASKPPAPKPVARAPAFVPTDD